jgi:Fuc2NAc and GlcNAc transferase
MLLIVVTLFTVVLSLLGVQKIRNVSLEKQWLDHPNSRSSHSVPTPRGAGLAILLVVGVVLFFLAAGGTIEWRLLVVLVPVAAIAGVGFIDDRQGVSARKRLGCHLVCSLISTSGIFFPFEKVAVPFGSFELSGTALVIGFATLFIGWMVNLYNFMDGIDGIEAIQVISVSAIAGGAALFLGYEGIGAVYLVLAAGFVGFLFMNWHPASIFLGDVGSGSVGFILGVIAIYSSQSGLTSFTTILILHGTFIVDTALTLIVRVVQGKRPQEAHRTHAYQKAVRAGLTHRLVSALYGVMNFVWLFPWAWLAHSNPTWAPWCLLAAWLPLAVFCWRLKVGIEPAVI